MKVWLDKNCPNANAILGALLSGGDPIKLAKILILSSIEGEKDDSRRI